jgi:hypothetical protein
VRVSACSTRHQRGDTDSLQPVILPDFSVVLFRSDFVLFSEKNHVKVLKNQRVWTMPYPPERLSGATSTGQTTPAEVQKPSQ